MRDVVVQVKNDRRYNIPIGWTLEKVLSLLSLYAVIVNCGKDENIDEQKLKNIIKENHNLCCCIGMGAGKALH